jgi:hypothetical protein
MDNRQKAFLKAWEKSRAQGRLRYVLINSLIFFVLLFCVTSVLNFGALRNGDYSSLLDPSRIGMYLVASLLIVVMRWRRNERTYNDLKE